ncbi:MAG: hypothetical protein CM15mP109_03840 [Candidatus Dadabacteria bacterium]|nr:MAG: hypothetical protein CM15mP109_03840 [Candidatus Dadabacteria bacterium]
MNKNNKYYKKISVIGAGAWGTALAEVISRQGSKVNLWAREDNVVNSINTSNTNDLYLPNIKLSELISAHKDFSDVLNCDLMLMVTPAQFMRPILNDIKDNLHETIPIVLCSKGIETKTLNLMSEIAEAIIPNNPLAVLSGPSFAIDVVNNKPTAVTLACKDLNIGKNIADSISLPKFRPYLSEDVIGAQIGGATKNVIAIAAGVVEGQNLGDSSCGNYSKRLQRNKSLGCCIRRSRGNIIWIIWNWRFTANMQLCNLTKFFTRNKAGTRTK